MEQRAESVTHPEDLLLLANMESDVPCEPMAT